MIDSKALKKKWNENTEIVQKTFERYHLVANSYGFCSIREDGTMTLLVEIATMEEYVFDDYVAIKVNFYDENGIIIYNTSDEIDAISFSGFDTLEMFLPEYGLAFDAVRCKIYATKE